MRGIAFASLLVVASLSGCAGQPDRPAAPPLALPAPYEHDRLADHLQAVARPIGRAAGMNVTVTILDSPVANGFALPGGHVYLTRGLVMMARHDEDWADMISHQIAHLIAAQGKRSTLDRVLGIARSLLDGLLPWTSDDAPVPPPALRPFTPDEEAVANRIGIRLMRDAGYSLAGIADGREHLRSLSAYQHRILGQQDENDIAHLHPLDQADLAKALEAVGSARPDDPVPGDASLMLLEGMLYGDAVRGAVIKDQILLHPALGLAFQLPKDSKLRIDGRTVHALGANGSSIRLEASGFRGDASGAIMAWGRAEGVRRAERIRIADRPAATGLLRGPEGDRLARVIALPDDEGHMWRLQVELPGADAPALTRLAQAMTGTARPLTDVERQQTAPLRIKVGLAPAMGELRRRISALPVPEPDILFALLNGLPPGKWPSPGQRIKWVVP